MARISQRLSTKFIQENDKSYLKFALASLPLAIVLIYFIVEAYFRPTLPYYNLSSSVTDDAVIRQAAIDSGSLVPLMDMVTTICSFCVAWAIAACYFLGYLGARSAIIERFLDEGKSITGNVVHEQRWWACEFRHYGYASYTHPDPDEAKNGAVVRKQVRIFEPYTREKVPVLCLPGYPQSGQGKEDLEYANAVCMRDRPREIFQGRFCLGWAVVCALIPLYILHQMSVIDQAESYAGITDDYDNVQKGWVLYGLFMGVGVVLVAMGGTALCWFYRRWWILHQGDLEIGDISRHGVEPNVSYTESHQSAEEYQRMQYP